MSIDTAAPIRLAPPTRFEGELEARPDKDALAAPPDSGGHTIHHIIDAAPPLTNGQRERLAVILGGGRR